MCLFCRYAAQRTAGSHYETVRRKAYAGVEKCMSEHRKVYAGAEKCMPK